MNLRRLFNLGKDTKSQLEPEAEKPKTSDDLVNHKPSESELIQIWPEPDIDLTQYDFTPDVLGQGRDRLFYPLYSPQGAHSEEYENALQIAEGLNNLYHQKERMDYWDANYRVFGLASCVVFDTQEKMYGPHHGYSQSSFLSVLEPEKNRYKAFYIYPHSTEEIWPFMHWCMGIQKCDFTILLGLGNQTNYWKDVKEHEFPKEFLEQWIAEVESYRDRANDVTEYWGPTIDEINQHLIETGSFFGSKGLRDEKAKKIFFYYGIKDRTKGKSFDHNLYLIFQDLITCPLSTYGQIFSSYLDGFHTIEMLAFLRKQKKRLEKGEDDEALRFPAVDIPSQPVAEDEQPFMDVSHLEDQPGGSPSVDVKERKLPPNLPKFIFIEEKRRNSVARQLGYDLDETNKDRLAELLGLVKPDDKIYTKTGVKVLADYFKQIFQAGHIDNVNYTKDEIGEWLAYWFVNINGKPYKPESFKDYLQMTDNNNKARSLTGRIKYS